MKYKIAKNAIILAIQYPRFGPYHIARINFAFNDLKRVGIKVVGIETDSFDDTYAWDKEVDVTDFERYIALSGVKCEKASKIAIWRSITSVLDKIKPNAIAICGYRSHDALCSLTWATMNRSKTILMSDSKHDDMPRKIFIELAKKILIRFYDTAICSGSLSRQYLQHLGMKQKNIFFGADVIDNDYFRLRANISKQNPEFYRSFIGLESSEPFFLASGRFVKLKNFDGLLRAYSIYRLEASKRKEIIKPWRLVVIGDGCEMSSLKSIVASENIDGVSFPGFLQKKELPVYYGLASAFIHPAHKDTWGLVVNEAMAAGLPVIVSKSTGCATDLVVEGENGFTFDSRNVYALKELMIKISSNKIDLRSMGRASQYRIKGWDLKSYSFGLYKAIIDQI